jgi:exopolyphosphatase/guanosine-5'-triphosphate,3'-diphosphate pyrophosphatase
VRISTIDIGTNTILMLIADVLPDGRFSVIRDEHTIARLGKGVDAQRNIQQETFERCLTILTGLKKISDTSRSTQIYACGTSALRDAANRDEFIDYIRSSLGFTIHVLSGEEEARLTYLGGASQFFPLHPETTYAVLDIGGGSTELVVGSGMNVHQKISMNIGAVRITERFLHASPPSNEEIASAEEEIRRHLSHAFSLPVGTTMIGVAGTLTTLAAIDLQLPEFDAKAIDGYILSIDTIDRIFEHLQTCSFKELCAIPQILPQRADIILAGILILRLTMRMMHTPSITVSTRGLRYGLLYQAGETLP